MEKDDLAAIRTTPLPPKHQTGSTGRPLTDLSDDEMKTLQRHTRSLWQIARQLRQRRFKNGSLDLDMTEIKIYVDPDGYADRIEKQENDESHQLIEEFMLSANEQGARQMKRNRFPCLYRVHDEPDEENSRNSDKPWLFWTVLRQLNPKPRNVCPPKTTQRTSAGIHP